MTIPGAEMIDRITGPENGVVGLVIQERGDWESDPLLVKNLRAKILEYQKFLASSSFRSHFPDCRGKIILEVLIPPPEEVKRIMDREGVAVRVVKEIHDEALVVPSPAEAKAQREAEPQVVQPPPRQPERQDDELEVDDLDDPLLDEMGASAGGGSNVTAIVLAVVALLGLVYAIAAGTSSSEKSPTTVQAREVSAKSLKNNTYATVTLRPDPKTRTLVPVQDRSGDKEKNRIYVLFASLENRGLLIFAEQSQSQILEEFRYVKDPEEGKKKLQHKWASDLRGHKPKPRPRTYRGVLEKLQQVEGGPLVLKLPEENININQLPGLAGAQIRFPKDSMVLRVGKKPSGSGSHTVILVLSLLLGAVALIVFLMGRRQATPAI